MTNAIGVIEMHDSFSLVLISILVKWRENQFICVVPVQLDTVLLDKRRLVEHADIVML